MRARSLLRRRQRVGDGAGEARLLGDEEAHDGQAGPFAARAGARPGWRCGRRSGNGEGAKARRQGPAARGAAPTGRGTSSWSGPQSRARVGAKIGASSIAAARGRWAESSSPIASAKSTEPMAASYLRSTQARRLVRSSLRDRSSRAGTLEAHSASNSESIAVPMAMLTHGSNALASGRPKASSHDGGISRRPSRSLAPSVRSSAARAVASRSLFGVGTGSGGAPSAVLTTK